MRIHWFSPLPPARTDIAHFTARILPALRARAEVTLWTSQSEWLPELEAKAEVRRFHPDNLPARSLDGADAAFFHIGNSAAFHRDIWQICRRYPGVAVLHDVLLHDAVVNHCRISPEVEGAYSDGWIGGRMSVAYAEGGRPRRLTVHVRPPEWAPGAVSVQVLDGNGGADLRVMPPDGLEIVRDLPRAAGRIELRFSPAMTPAACHAGPDTRAIGGCLESTIIDGPGGTLLLNGGETYRRILESMYGPRGRRDAELHWRGILSLDRMAEAYSCIPFMLEAGRGVVVHSHMAERAVRRESRLPIARLALPAPAGAVPARDLAMAPPWRLLVFGHLGPNRGLDQILDALGQIEERARFRLEIIGSLHDPGAAAERIARLGLQELATIRGAASEAELEAALDRAHLAINLRYPTRGEASGAQLRIWRHGLPSIVTKIGWYAEQSEDVVAFVRPGHMTEDLIALLRSYDAAPERFARMGIAGYRHFAAHHSPEQYVDGLLALAARVGGGR